jgi:hypothetical protein
VVARDGNGAIPDLPHWPRGARRAGREKLFRDTMELVAPAARRSSRRHGVQGVVGSWR